MGPNIARNESRRRADAIGWDFSPINMPGIGGVSTNAQGDLRFSMDPRLAGFQNQLYGGARQGLTSAQGLRGEMGGYASSLMGAGSSMIDSMLGDPLGRAESRFSGMLGVLDRRHRGRRESIEQNLFNQGRLGSSGGAVHTAEYDAARDAEEAQLLDQMYQQEQGYGLQAGGLGANLMGAGANLQGGLFSQALQEGQMAPAQSAHVLAMMNPGMQMGNARMNALIARHNAIMGHNTNMAGTAQTGFGEALLGAAGVGLGAAFGGPLGAAAGAGIANMFSSPAAATSPGGGGASFAPDYSLSAGEFSKTGWSR